MATKKHTTGVRGFELPKMSKNDARRLQFETAYMSLEDMFEKKVRVIMEGQLGEPITDSNLLYRSMVEALRAAAFDGEVPRAPRDLNQRFEISKDHFKRTITHYDGLPGQPEKDAMCQLFVQVCDALQTEILPTRGRVQR